MPFAECQAAIVMKYSTLSLCIVCFLIGVAYCSYNRTMLRQKFGIAGVTPECLSILKALGLPYACPSPYALLPSSQGLIVRKLCLETMCDGYLMNTSDLKAYCFGAAGSRFGDFCTWCWCAPCALCQVSTSPFLMSLATYMIMHMPSCPLSFAPFLC